jgi:hypothetical protein
MIRRDAGGDWLIIDQIEHARLAAEMARVWRHDEVPARLEVDGLFFGVARHDDGWANWDGAPRIDAATGMPRDFREMRMADSTAIWSKSIDVCSTVPLAAVAVSRHFCFLAEQARATRHEPDDLQAAERFLAEQAVVQCNLANQAHAAGIDGEFDRWCQIGFRTVQFFDSLSLWLCCAERHAPHALTAPGGQCVNLVPGPNGRIVIAPYALQVDPLVLHAPVRRIAARTYRDDRDLGQALLAAPSEELTWTLSRTEQ